MLKTPKDLDTPIQADVANRQVQEGLVRIMIMHEMLALKNTLSDSILNKDGKTIRADSVTAKNPTLMAARKLKPEMAVINKLKLARQRMAKLTKKYPKFTEFDYNMIKHGSPQDKGYHVSSHAWSEMTPQDQKTYESSFALAQQNENQVLSQYYLTDDFRADYPAQFSAAQKRLEGSLKMTMPAGAVQSIYNSASVTKVFDMKYPGARKELAAQMKSGNEEMSKSAKAMGYALTGVAMLNPTTFLVGKAFGALMNTNTMKPVKEEMLKSLQHVGRKSGFTAKLDMMNETKMGRIAVKAAAVTGVGLLAAMGVADNEMIMDYAGQVFDEIATPNAPILPDNTNEFSEIPAVTPAVDTQPPMIDGVTGRAGQLAANAASSGLDTTMDAVKASVESPTIADANVPTAPLMDSVPNMPSPFSSDLAGAPSPFPDDLAGMQSPPAVDAPSKPPMIDGVTSQGSQLAANAAGSDATLDAVKAAVDGPTVDGVAPASATAGVPTTTPADVSDKDLIALDTPKDTTSLNVNQSDFDQGVPGADDTQPSTPDVPDGLAASVYNVEYGDTLSEIAKARLTEAGIPHDYPVIHEMAKMIAAENGMQNIHQLDVGDLKLPAIDNEIGNKLIAAAEMHNNEVYAMAVDPVEPPADIPQVDAGQFAAQYDMSVKEAVQKVAVTYDPSISEDDVNNLVSIMVTDNPGVEKVSRGDVVNVSGVENALKAKADLNYTIANEHHQMFPDPHMDTHSFDVDDTSLIASNRMRP